MSTEIAVVALFSIATAVALVARRLNLPYTVALVIAGLALGATRAIQAPTLTKELLYAVFLPGLLFDAAFQLEFRKFLQNKITVVGLALPGMLASVILTTLMLVPLASSLHFVERFSVADALVFAAIVAATDPIAVIGLFKSLGAPKRLAILVEGESLLNDGTAVVLFTLVLSFVLGHPTSIPLAILDFVRVVGVGALIGAAIGYAASFVIHKVDDPMIEITLTTIAAYGSFVAAENFHYSGVIATVTAGMLCGNTAARTGMTASTRVAVTTFWEYLAFALNSLVFLLIGFQVRIGMLLDAYKPILAAFFCITVGRAVVIYAVALVLRRTSERFPLSWATVITWGGLRGGLSMVLVLGLPVDLPNRELLVAMTFGVVILSILVQGLTMGPLLRKLGLVASSELHALHDRLRGVTLASRAALGEIERLERQRGFADEVLAEIRQRYETRIRESEAEAASLQIERESVLAEDRLVATRHALFAEKDALQSAYRSGHIAERSYEELLADVDARIFELDSEKEA